MRPGYYLDKEGRPLDRAEFARLFEDMEYRRIDYDELDDGRSVSTVWLGIDHWPDELGRPLLFETMAFAAAPEGTLREEIDCRRTATVDEARRAHAAVLATLKPVAS